MVLQNIKVKEEDRTYIDEIKKDNPRNVIVSSALSTYNHFEKHKNEILMLIEYLEENTFCMRGDEKRIQRARAKLSHLINGV